MSTVSSHQVATPFAGPIPGTTNRAADVLANDNALAAQLNAHDADATVHVQSSVLAARPGFGTAGRLWFASDTREWWYDTGAAWVPLAQVSGPLTVTDSLTVSGTSGGFAPASLFRSTTFGIGFAGATGSTYDFVLFSPAGSGVLQVPTGTLDALLGGGVKPVADAAQDVGGAANRWRDVYVSRLLKLASAVTTASPSAGAASALPATPAGYVAVEIAGVARVIPFY